MATPEELSKAMKQTQVLKRSELNQFLSPQERLDLEFAEDANTNTLLNLETVDNLNRADVIKNSKSNNSLNEVYSVEIICSQCESLNTFTTNKIFDKVSCPNCQLDFRIPVETPFFIYDKHIFESPYINIFRAYNKEKNYHGDAVVYEKLPTADGKASNIQGIFDNYEQLKITNYLNPKFFIKDESAYYFTRENAPYRMNLYIQKYGALPEDQAYHILNEVNKTLISLAKYHCFGALLPSDIMLKTDGTVLVGDYAFREAIHAINKTYNYIPLRYLAPETIYNKLHTEVSAVYSLALIAVKFLSGSLIFKTTDPHKINCERKAFLENFNHTNLDPFIKKMLSKNSRQRPSLKECQAFFASHD